jgi:hypothetical protein
LANTSGELVGVITCTYQRAPSFHTLRSALLESIRQWNLRELLVSLRRLVGMSQASPEQLEDLKRKIISHFERLLEPERDDELDMEPSQLGGIFPGAYLGAEGINFAVPADKVKLITDHLIKEGKVERAYLGITVRPVSPELRAQLSIPQGAGLVIGSVATPGPAAEAGIKPWDVLLRIGSCQITDSSELDRLVLELSPGSEVPAELVRQGKKITVRLKLGKR